MSLIIQKLVDGKKKGPVTMEDVDRSKVEEEFDTEKVKVYRYDSYSHPAGYSKKINRKVVYNGSIEEVPVKIWKKKGSQLLVDKENLAEELAENYGSGQYSVFKFGGNPPKEPYFENRFIEKKKNNSSENKEGEK